MKRYYKEEDGKRVWLGQILKINGKQIINPSEEQILSAGYVLYTPPTPLPPTDEELLERAKNDKIRELKNYDESEEVNDCIILYNGEEIHYWAKVKERTELKNTVRDCIAVGRDMYRLDLRDKGISITLPCETLLLMLAALEIYAVDCYNKTTDHEFAIKILTTIEEIELYNFTTGYPEKLIFNL